MSSEGDREERSQPTFISKSSIQLFDHEFPVQHQLPQGWLLQKPVMILHESKGGNKLMEPNTVCAGHVVLAC